MANNIVQILVSTQVAPAPSALQKTGALISQGGTTGAAQTKALLTQPSDLTPLLTAAQAIAPGGLVWAGSVVTATTTAPHGYPTGQTIPLTIAGAAPAAYNGTVQASITGASTFTYALASNPGSETTPGVVTDADVSELLAMATTFFAQGSAQAVYVLELGVGDVAHGVAALTTWLAANPTGAPGSFYSYLVPREWDNAASFLTLIASYEANTSKTYFYVTTTTGTYTNYTAVMKCVKLWIEAPGIPATEFTAAADFYNNLNLTPSSTNKVTPNAFDFVFGVTSYPTVGNSVFLTALKAAAVNYVGIGSEGGLSNTIVLWGTLKDGNDFTFWYSIDWLQIQVDLAISNAVINGSNNPVNPLYYNQDGINRLQDVAFQTITNGVTFGLILNGPLRTALDGPVFTQNLENNNYVGFTVVNAVPFVNYVAENPSDFTSGKYAGFTIANYTPNRGFILIVFVVNINQLAT
jgi:hypothetical protein